MMMGQVHFVCRHGLERAFPALLRGGRLLLPSQDPGVALMCLRMYWWQLPTLEDWADKKL